MPKLSVKDLMAIGAYPSDPVMTEEEAEEYLEVMNPRNFAYPIVHSDPPLDPEDQEAIEGILGIEIRTMYEDADEPLPGVGLRVYLKTENGITIEDTRSDKDGYYSFAKLAPYTKYIVYAEHEPEKDMGIVAVTEEITTGAVGEIVKVENDLAVKIF